MVKGKIKKRINMKSLTEQQRRERLIKDIQEAKYVENDFMKGIRELVLRYLSTQEKQSK